MLFAAINIAYIFAHGITSVLVIPLQENILPETALFSALIYFPHGVRILATWAFGWKAVIPLFTASLLSVWIFGSEQEVAQLSPQLWHAAIFGSVSALLAFEFARIIGFSPYVGEGSRLSWRGMVYIGALASVINSIGQTVIFSDTIGIENLGKVLTVFFVGDLVGVILCMVLLMFIFRWLRFSRPSKNRTTQGKS